jgi:hypothetical protein
MQSRLGCDNAAPSGVDFNTSRVMFVRQGMRVGEVMGVQPVEWLVEDGANTTVGEARRSFCTGGQPLTGGVVSYAITMPLTVPTSSTSTISRFVCFRRVRCDCSEEEACGG